MIKDKIIKQILIRLDRLELTVFGDKEKSKKMVKKERNIDFKGITGGIRLMIFKGFVKNRKRTFNEIKESLNKNGYYSSRQAIQAALDQLSTPKGPLRKIKEGKKNYYAERK